MKEIKAIIQPFMVNHVLHALHGIPGLPAVTVSEVRAIDTRSGRFEQVVKSRLEIMVPDEQASAVMHAIQIHAHTGKSGDGRVFVIPIEDSVSIRTGEAKFVRSTDADMAISQNALPLSEQAQAILDESG